MFVSCAKSTPISPTYLSRHHQATNSQSKLSVYPPHLKLLHQCNRKRKCSQAIFGSTEFTWNILSWRLRHPLVLLPSPILHFVGLKGLQILDHLTFFLLGPPAEMETVWLQRPNGDVPWGFRLQGGRDYGQPLTVQRVSSYNR